MSENIIKNIKRLISNKIAKKTLILRKLPRKNLIL